MKFYVGERLNVKVNNITNLGIFVTLPKRHHGLIHHSDFGDKWANKKSKFEIGKELRVVITSINNGKIGLSLNRVNDSEIIDCKNPFNKESKFNDSLDLLLTESSEKINQLKTILDK